MLLLTLATLSAPAASPKRVLFIHSFGRGFEPYHTVAGRLRTELASQVAEPIDFFEASLESARFTGLEQESPLLEYLRAQFAGHHLDLVVPVGGPAAQFVQRHRQQLFPETPMLAVVDQRLFDPSNLTTKDAAALAVNEPGLTVEMLLQVLPDTTNVVVVMGNSAIERFWSAQVRRELQPYTNGVSFVWLDQLPFSEMLKQCAALPPRSAIFFPLLFVDAGGVPHLEEHAMLRLHEAANVPIFGIWKNQLGQGILGGRLMDIEEYSRNAATAAARILRGESPGTIKMPPQRVGPPEFDWRELRRWGISETRLPAGSVVRLRQPQFWELYRWRIVGGTAFCFLQTVLIFALIVNRAKRREQQVEMRQLYLALEQSPVSVVMTDPEGKMVFVNRKFCEVSGYSRGESIGQNPRILKSGESPSSAYEELWTCITSGKTWQGEFHNRKKSGELYWEWAVISPVLDATGRITGFVGVKEDITSRKQAEEARRESDARLASAVEVAGLGFYEMGTDPRQLFVDDRLRLLLGLPPQANHRVQEFWIEHIHPDDRERVQELSRKVLGGELPGVSLEYRYQHPERGTLWFSHVSRTEKQDANGKTVRRIGVIHDITEQRRAELESQRLRSNLAHLTRVNTLGALSGSLAHELNQPLGIILSNAQAAQELLTQEPPDTAEVQAILTDIVKADRRAGEVILRMRALFKGGQASLQSLSLNTVIEEVLNLTRAELLGRGVTTTCDLDPNLPLIAGDRVQLQQLVLNLILNAADAMAANAPGSRRLHLRTTLHLAHVRASVRDEGEGLPADVERLFQPLYTTKPQGLGLGLAICRSIVGAHGGRLWAERHPERGAVFCFKLPVASEDGEKGSGVGVQDPGEKK